MPLIYVKSLEGRVSFTAPFNGRLIPSDNYIMVNESPFIRRMIDVHGDIYEKSSDEKKQAVAAEQSFASNSETPTTKKEKD